MQARAQGAFIKLSKYRVEKEMQKSPLDDSEIHMLIIVQFYNCFKKYWQI